MIEDLPKLVQEPLALYVGCPSCGADPWQGCKTVRTERAAPPWVHAERRDAWRGTKGTVISVDYADRNRPDVIDHVLRGGAVHFRCALPPDLLPAPLSLSPGYDVRQESRRFAGFGLTTHDTGARKVRP